MEIGVTDTPAPSLTPRPSATATVTATDTPQPSWTPVPSLTPSITPSLTPSITPTATALWCGAQTNASSTPAPALALQWRMAFVNGKDLWSVESGGQPRALTQSQDVLSALLSEDGEWIAYERQVNSQEVEIWVSSADGKVQQRLVSAARLRAMNTSPGVLAVRPHHLTWIPHRHTLAFSSQPVYAMPQLYQPDDLWLADVGLETPRLILPHGQGAEFVYSPDGREVALLRPDSLSLIHRDGSGLRFNVLKGYRATLLNGQYEYPQTVWAADSLSLRVGLPVASQANDPNPEVQIWEVPVTGVSTALKKMGVVKAFPPSLTFSPDLTKVAFLRGAGLNSPQRELHLADVSGSIDQVYMVGANLQFASWAPDSQTFAYWLPESGKLEYGQPCTAPQALTRLYSLHGSVHWLDAQHFLFFSGQPKAWTLYLGQLGAEGSQVIAGMDSTRYSVIVLPPE